MPSTFSNRYDVIVIGGGHAGCEAARASAVMGCKTLLITMDMNKIAQMSCNPSVGGIAKGQIVREIDALGGYMGLVTDASTVQFRMLNSSKGPAVWSPRAQCDRQYFILNWRYVLEHTPNLSIWQDTVSSFLLTGEKSGQKIKGVVTALGAEFSAGRVILTAGTFLEGKMFIGTNSADGGRVGEPASYGLTKQLKKAGIVSGRMKTGTPPRIDIRSIDTSSLICQQGDKNPQRFSFLNVPSAIQTNVEQMCCYIVHTNKSVHSSLKRGFKYSPLFSGTIKGIGPRYCPSIEDKLRTFADKESHLLFLEPEGWSTNEYYLQGFSSSLPLKVQLNALRKIEGLEKVEIFRPGYAVEYDYFPPTQLYHTLESRHIKGLYFAGQVNGTTGYEEAAAQGLVAGINAALSTMKKEPFILKRNESYIGVLIDDLVTKGVDEPYRMFTSRAEFRILLRQDNADLRLTKLGYELGLASEQRYRQMREKYSVIDKLISLFNTEKLEPQKINPLLEQLGSSPISERKTIASILARPNIPIERIVENVPRGTDVAEPVSDYLHKYPQQYGEPLVKGCFIMPYRPKDFKINNSLSKHSAPLKDLLEMAPELFSAIDIAVKYRGYIQREEATAERILRLERLKIPAKFDFMKITSLSMEGRQKLLKYRPKTIAEASRIPGVSPADISVLLVYFGR